MEIKKIAGALGAEVLDVDLACGLEPATVAAIRHAWLEHCVIFFRDQHLTPAQFMALAACFGAPVEYPFIKGLPGFPCITPVVKLEHERANFGGIWHSDTTYLTEPPMGTLLLACELPPVGGDTLFANQYLAYETLSDGLRQTLGALVAISSSAKADVSKTREDRLKTDGRDDAKREYTAEQPVVRTHPETGRKALYVNVAHTARFKGWSEEESAPLLNTGVPVRSRCGTIAARSTTRSMITTVIGASCTGSRWRAIVRAELPTQAPADRASTRRAQPRRR
jgi:taurine dioxygenase